MGFSGLSMLLLLFATILLPNIAVAKVYIVGDQIGWTNGFDYQAWAAGKTFAVGDVLVFRYPVGYHDVFEVSGTAFQSCTVPPPSEALTSGIDIIQLATPGRKWYICGVGNHCQDGQKLVIDVVEPPALDLPLTPGAAPAPAPAPAPASASASDAVPAPALPPPYMAAPAPFIVPGPAPARPDAFVKLNKFPTIFH